MSSACALLDSGLIARRFAGGPILEQLARADGRGTSRLPTAAWAGARPAPRRRRRVPGALESALGRRRGAEALQPHLPARPLARIRQPARHGGARPALDPPGGDARARRARLRYRRRRRRGTRPGGRASPAGPERGRAGRRAAAADPAPGDAADVHRVGRDRRGLEGRVHHVRDVLPDLPHHRQRRAADRSAPPARGPEPRRARARALHARDPAGRPAGHPDRAPARRGTGLLRHRHLGVHRRRARSRLPHQRRPQLLPRAADARRRRGAGAARLRGQRARAAAGAPPDPLAASRVKMAGPKIQIQRVGKSFGAPGHALPALAGIDLDVAEREFVCLLGPSGCGKSTLLNIAAGFLAPTTGTVLVDGRPVSGPAPERGVVFQEYALFPWLTVTGNVEFGPLLQSRPAAERRQTVDRYLNLVGLRAHADKYPVQLSGGMKQRVAIARALANNPAVILMDEPFGALDAQTREVLQDELGRIQRVEHKTILFVTHSIREAVYLADRVVVMTSAPGRIKQIFPIKLPEVRDRFAPEFTQYESDITRVVREEVAKVQE